MNWQYRTIELAAFGFLGGKLDTLEFERRLNQIGREGWELVNVFDTNQHNGATRNVIAVFKKPS